MCSVRTLSLRHMRRSTRPSHASCWATSRTRREATRTVRHGGEGVRGGLGVGKNMLQQQQQHAVGPMSCACFDLCCCTRPLLRAAGEGGEGSSEEEESDSEGGGGGGGGESLRAVGGGASPCVMLSWASERVLNAACVAAPFCLPANTDMAQPPQLLTACTTLHSGSTTACTTCL